MALETAQAALKQSNNISTICDEMHEEIQAEKKLFNET